MMDKNKQKPKMKIKRKEKGQSMVELALTFMIMMFALAGTVDLGRAFFALIALNDAAQEGALYGSMNPTEITTIKARVRDSSTAPIDLTDTTNVNINVTYPETEVCAGFDGTGEAYGIKVEVTFLFNFSMPLITEIVNSDTITLGANSIHTILYPPCS